MKRTSFWARSVTITIVLHPLVLAANWRDMSLSDLLEEFQTDELVVRFNPPVSCN